MPGSMLSVSPAYWTTRSPPALAPCGGVLWLALVSPPLLLLPPPPHPATTSAATTAMSAGARKCALVLTCSPSSETFGQRGPLPFAEHYVQNAPVVSSDVPKNRP